ncbi:MAG: elongator complex protein 3 [Eubacteriales bacterium]
MAKRHLTVPIFVPHLGCPHDCVFCNQRKITGQSDFSLSEVEATIERNLAYAGPDTEAEIAFFGGSFTGIDRTLMTELLSIAHRYLQSGRITGIRCSTRPDYISDEILEILHAYGLGTIEIGVQSLSDPVLYASARGHSAACTLGAMDKITKAGFDLVGQMMLGLPGSTPEDEIRCAEGICRHGAVGARIYPTAVFEGTALHTMMLRGEYQPLTVTETVQRGASVMDVFVNAGVRLLRVGLCETESLHGDGGIVAGGYHPAIGELCASELYYRRIENALASLPDIRNRDLRIMIPVGALSKAIGQKRGNKDKIMQKYAPKSLHFAETEGFSEYQVRVEML